MNKSTIALGLLLCATFAYAQKGKFIKTDTIKVQQIEDINLHKTGNPNKAKPLSTKSNLTVMETPQPIAIVTHEIIEQQQAKQLSDVLQNVNGIYVTSSRGNSQDSFGGRGFILGNDNIFKNGARVNSGVFPEVTGLERVEVLKGANAMLYGNTAAGGIINMVTKKPRFQTGGSFSLSGGSWNTYKPTFDVYGPISKDVAFRLNGTYETAKSFRDHVSSEKIYLNPSILFNIGKKSQLIVEGDYLINNFTPDFGIGSITNKDGSYSMNTLLPRNAFLGANWQYQDVKQASTNITFNHQISNNWSLNVITSYQNYTKDYFSTERVQWEYDKNNRLNWKRPLNKTYNEQNYTSFQANVNGEFNTGKINHKVLIGADSDYGAADSYTYFNPSNNKTYGTGYIYGTGGGNGILYLDDTSTWSSGSIPASAIQDRNRIRTRRVGIYVQDFISLSKEFKVLAGLRWSYIQNMPTINTNFRTNTKKLVDNSSTSDQALSPKVGLVYMPNDNLSLFATYTNSFSANTGYDINRSTLKPTTIDQYEVGVKKNLWNNAIAVNLSAYQILYKNYYQTAELNAGGQPNSDPNMKEFAGKMRSRGVELDITGNPSKNLSLIGGISYNNSVYLDTPDNFGYVENQRIVRTPATTANLSAFYTLPKYIKGLKIGASFYYIGDRLAGWNDTKATNNSRNGVSRIFTLKDYTTFALSMGYDWKKFSIQAKVNNLFDTVNYNVHENYSVNPIAPRNYYFTLTYRL
ncbi:TonB-dependent siderophore receptor [Elizabethkingia anophelis]|uniref:Outer-membrane receptor for Fe(III)-coprogen, Fe(III)-ferrioxamine B and Fe(III)-rhodotrulic acid n=1 Tax=Elizabethkingia anophelis TaxID=1117645 RepID=A0A7Z7PXB5_9FLAO|nr:TonB-dependent receptor [Elizabethkingia anophelis]MCT3629247.1 TonB-dependent receptor [Elizabethkingia anophelis]MCT3632906.1 TonB-dependent receptor [Elizabethkingia anophelis]MCT3829491.1 TonB-dependent receptor [Elizabethkingia anophelis]MCT3882966.1 TonB-dependent receptor [Elizabethkingia anophelis]MCT3893879.1 TonB-dependent receptor [Elizabethkingia anophelis]